MRAKKLTLDIDGWQLQVAPCGDGVLVGIKAGPGALAATHYVRLNEAETAQLREYFAPKDEEQQIGPLDI